MNSNVRAGSSPASSTLRDKSSFLDLSLFLFFRFTLLKRAILCRMGLISAVRTFLFSNKNQSADTTVLNPVCMLPVSGVVFIRIELR